MNNVCVHESGKYNLIDPLSIPGFFSETKFVRNEDSISKRIYEGEFVTWKLETDTPDIEGRLNEQKMIKLVMLQIGILIPLKVRQVRRSQQEAEIVITFAQDIPFFIKRPSVLAFAYGPADGIGGDITFNDKYIWSLDVKPLSPEEAISRGFIENADPRSTIRTWDVHHTMLHEALHAFGLPHLENQGNVMNPYYNGERIMQTDDVNYIQLLYGKSSIGHRYWERILSRFGRGVMA